MTHMKERRLLTSFWCSLEQKNIQSVPNFAHSLHLFSVFAPQTTHSPLELAELDMLAREEKGRIGGDVEWVRARVEEASCYN